MVNYQHKYYNIKHILLIRYQYFLQKDSRFSLSEATTDNSQTTVRVSDTNNVTLLSSIVILSSLYKLNQIAHELFGGTADGELLAAGLRHELGPEHYV